MSQTRNAPGEADCQRFLTPTDQRLLDLVGDIYEASLTPSHWDSVMARLCQWLGLKSGGLFIQDRELNSHTAVALYGLPPISRLTYNLGLGRHDVGWKAVAEQDVGTARQYLCEEDARHKHPFYYQMIMRPNGIHHMAGVSIYNDQEWCVALGLHRSKAQGPFDEATLSTLATLAPHFGRAMRIQKEFHRLRVENFRLSHSLSRVMVGIVIVNDARRIVYANPIAEQILSQHPALKRRGDVLSAFNATDTAKLNNAIDELLQADNASAYHPGLGLTHPHKTTPLAVILNKADASHNREDLILPARAVAIYLTDPDLAIKIHPDTLNRIYALTPAESRVAIQIANGLTVKEIAAHNQVSVLTVRTQLRHVFEKMGINRQQEITKLLLSNGINVTSEPVYPEETSILRDPA